MKRPRLRAYLGLGLLAAGLCGLALSGDLLQHPERRGHEHLMVHIGHEPHDGAAEPDAEGHHWVQQHCTDRPPCPCSTAGGLDAQKNQHRGQRSQQHVL